VKLQIDKQSPLPLYKQIFDQIQEAILTGKVEYNSKLPSERELSDSMGISRMTIRRAFEKLANNGLITSMHGKGIFVSPPKTDVSVQYIMNFFSDMRQRGLVPESKLLSVKKVTPPKEISEFLFDRDQDEVLKIERLLMGNRVPYAYETKYLDYKKCLQLKKSGYIIEGNDFKFLDECVRCWLYARVKIAIEEMDESPAQKVGFENCKITFLIEKKVHTFNNRPLSFILARYRSDVYSFKMNVFNYSNSDIKTISTSLQ
jgi:GntR family transcriptional regulator